jgi:hypothetical protein
MRPHKFTYTLAAASATGYLENATGATWTLAATTAGDECSHPVTIHNDSASDHSLKTAILTGTDAEDRVITETVNLPNVHGGGSDTTTSTLYYKTLVTVVPSATIGADTMDIGWTALARTPTFPTDTYPTAGPLIGVDLGGTTCNYAVQQTNDAVYDNNPASWQALQAAGTANTINQALVGTTGLRVTVAYHTTGVVIVTISQARA